MPVVRELLTRWGFDVDDKAVDRFKGRLNEAKTVAKWATGAIVGLAGAASALVVKLEMTGDRLAKMSRQLGMAAGDLQRLNFAADMGGASQAEMSAAIRFLSRAMDQAQRGSKAMTQTFQKLGVSALDTKGNMRPTVDVLMDIADWMQRTENGADKTATSMRLFGRGGMSMITVLEGGSAGLRELMQEADALGIVMDDKLLSTSEQFNDDLTRVKSIATSLAITIGSVLMPKLLRLLQRIDAWWKANRKIISQKLSEWVEQGAKAFGKLVDGFVEALRVGGDIIDWLGGVEGVLSKLYEAARVLIVLELASWFAALAPAVVAFVASLDAAAILAAVNPIFLLAAAIASIIVYKDEMQLGFEMFFAAIPRAITVIADKIFSFVETVANAWQDFVMMLSRGGAALGIMDELHYEKFSLERPQFGMTDEELRGVYGARMSDEEAAERNKKPRTIADITVGEPELAPRKITVSAAELAALTGGWQQPSGAEMARMGAEGRLVTAPISIGNNITIQLPAGASLENAEQVKRYVVPLVRQELQAQARILQEELATQ